MTAAKTRLKAELRTPGATPFSRTIGRGNLENIIREIGVPKEAMHEMSIAAAIAEQVLAVARQNNLVKVTQVRLRIGELRLIVPEALSAAWEAVREDSPAATATLEMTQVPARARCRKCRHEYHPEWPVFLCPACNQASVEVLAGEELVLEEITGETADETEATQ